MTVAFIVGWEIRQDLAETLAQVLPRLQSRCGLCSHLNAKLEKNTFPSSFRLLAELIPCGSVSEGPSFVLAEGSHLRA